MTQEEFDEMVLSGPRPSTIWRKAFDEYNQDKSTQITMSCMTYYLKVKNYMLDKYQLVMPDKNRYKRPIKKPILPRLNIGQLPKAWRS